MKQIFVAWVPFQRRQLSMESFFGFKSIFIHRDFKRKWLKPFEYLVKGWNTLWICIREKPGTVWAQVPPVPTLSVIFFYKLLFNRKLRVIADCHNCMFRPPWSSVPLAIWHLNQCDRVIVHNDTLPDQVRLLGVTRPIHVMEDAPAALRHFDVGRTANKTINRILFPASFSDDEPIQEILEAARLAPELDFFITGNPARSEAVHDLSNIPKNVQLTGFLSVNDFEDLFANADVILGLTTRDGIQLSVCNEAIGAGKPMVLSGTALLKRLFYKGAIYVDWTDPQSIAEGCRHAVSDNRRLENEVKALREERCQYWMTTQAMPIQKLLQEAFR